MRAPAAKDRVGDLEIDDLGVLASDAGLLSVLRRLTLGRLAVADEGGKEAYAPEYCLNESYALLFAGVSVCPLLYDFLP